jgi:hypothetical protein
MTTQTITEYLEEERKKAADTRLRTEEEAARIQPLQHGHHRLAKQSRMELVPPVKAVTKKKKTAAVARKKPRAFINATAMNAIKTNATKTNVTKKGKTTKIRKRA